MKIPGINQEKMIKSVINLAEILKKIFDMENLRKLQNFYNMEIPSTNLD